MLNKALKILIIGISLLFINSTFAEEWEDILNTPKIDFNTTIDETIDNQNIKINESRMVGSGYLKESLLNISSDNIVKGNTNNGMSSVQNIIIWIKDTLMGFLLLISVGIFLYIGIKIVFAKGNPEEFKKALMHLVYAIIGIFVISIAWAVVTLISGLSI